MSPPVTAPFATPSRNYRRRIDERHRRKAGGLPIFLPRMTVQKVFRALPALNLPQPQPGAPS